MPKFSELIKRTAANAASATAQVGEKAAPKVKQAASAVTQGVSHVAETALPVVRDTAKSLAQKTATAASTVAQKTASTATAVAQKTASAATTVAHVGSEVSSTAVNVVKDQFYAQLLTRADFPPTRPHTVINKKTSQELLVEVYVHRAGGYKDYDAVYPRGSKPDYGPIGNKYVGVTLILAGLTMLVLPGPGLETIHAGMYFMSKNSHEEAVRAADQEAEGWQDLNDASAVY
ncbi:MAG: hypothetical protein IKE43_05860 [Coriobacteriales bacterium]|nr:hypothetical protein [Coriobacteriales bacterium]